MSDKVNDELLSACENFFESWFGPVIGAPEHLERINARRERSKKEFAGLLYQFVQAWQPIIGFEPSGAGFVAVGNILKDLTNRRGLRQAREEIDPDIQADIKHVWALAITEVLDMQVMVIKHQMKVSI